MTRLKKLLRRLSVKLFGEVLCRACKVYGTNCISACGVSREERAERYINAQ